MSRSPSDVAADFNYEVAMGVQAAASRRGEMAAGFDYHIVSYGFPVPDFNLGFPKLSGNEIERTLQRIEDFFGARELPYRVVVTSESLAELSPLLVARGYAETARVPGMLLEPIDLAPPRCELRITAVEDAPGVLDFGRTAFKSFGFPEAGAAAVMTPQLFDDPALHGYVGYLGDEPVCTSLLYVTGTTAGIYWVGTLAGQRGRGFGEVMTAHASLEGRVLGCLRASLQASAMGRPVYERMGFRQNRDYRNFERACGSASKAG
jgi:GNAT superfamily N-acetyltransferase